MMSANRLAIAFAMMVGCGDGDWPAAGEGTLLVRVDVADSAAAWVSYRVWDERHELLRDMLLPSADFPRVLALTPEPGDPTGARFRGALIEVETWSPSLCPRGRASIGLRYGVSTPRSTLTVEAPDEPVDCTPLFVAQGGDDTGGCGLDDPCATTQEAVRRARGAPGRWVIHVAGGATYPALALSDIAQERVAPAPHVVRAWPGRALPEPPAFRAAEPRTCDPDETNPCNGNSLCIDGRCAYEAAISLCCQFDRSGVVNVEVDGLVARRGKRVIEINGGGDITLRHTLAEDGGGAVAPLPGSPYGAVPSGGIRVFEAPNTLLEHNRVIRSVDLTGRGAVPAVGILVDGIRARDAGGVTLRYNWVAGSQSAGLLVLHPNGPVSALGNTWCDNAGTGTTLFAGTAGFRAAHELFAGNGSPDLRAEQYPGPVAVTRSTFTGDGPSLEGLDASAVSSSVLRGVEAAGDNVVDPEDGPEVRDCLAGRPLPGVGACPSFPFCMEAP